MLDGTNVTGAMWSATSGALAIVMIDKRCSAKDYPTPSIHSIVLQDVVGAIVGSRLLVQQNPIPGAGSFSASYPQFNGTIVAINCTLVGDDPSVAMFDFVDVLRADITFRHVVVLGFLFKITDNSRSFDVGAARLNLLLHRCNVTLLKNNARLLAVSNGGMINKPSLLPSLPLNVDLQCESVHFEQQWESETIGWLPFTYPAVAMMSIINVAGTSISFASCSITIHQLSAPTPVMPAAFLLQQDGAPDRLNLTFHGSSFLVNGTTPGVGLLQLPMVSVGGSIGALSVNILRILCVFLVQRFFFLSLSLRNQK
jgi:hypothetical protein